MHDLTRRAFVKLSSVLGATLAGAAGGDLRAQAGGFQAAGGPDQEGPPAGGPGGPGGSGPGGPQQKGPGIQAVFALCEVTGGGQKVYGIAVQYDSPIDPNSVTLGTFAAGVVPAARGFFPGMPQEPNKNASTASPKPRPIASTYTNSQPALLTARASVPGPFVIAEFAHDPDLSLPTTDSDRVSISQTRPVRAASGTTYPASSTAHTNSGGRGNNVVIRGIDAWEQNHWWWDDTRATMLEYSIFLPKSFHEPGGENKRYPLVLAVTHSGTSYDGTCAQTLTEQCIASIWSMPEQQQAQECVVITPRYERTTMNDYWEHTYDVENTHRLVEFLLSGQWNYGNPNRDDVRDKHLLIDKSRVYCTGWSMGAMTSLWLMAHHPDTYAAGLIIAGQQRPADVVTLAHQKVLILTGSQDNKATPWNEKCIPVWQAAGAKVTRPTSQLDPSLIFPVDGQKELTAQVNGYLAEGGNITFLTFSGVDHMGSARKFFYIRAARDWLFAQRKT